MGDHNEQELPPRAPAGVVTPKMFYGMYTASCCTERVLICHSIGSCYSLDAFPAADLGLKRALDVDDLAAAAERWRPWRGYAAVRLWTRGATS